MNQQEKSFFGIICILILMILAACSAQKEDFAGSSEAAESFIADESTLPLARKYYITYSLDASFRNYSTLNADIFIHEIIGSRHDNLSDSGKHIDNKFIEGITDYTIEGYHKLNE